MTRCALRRVAAAALLAVAGCGAPHAGGPAATHTQAPEAGGVAPAAEDVRTHGPDGGRGAAPAAATDGGRASAPATTTVGGADGTAVPAAGIDAELDAIDSDIRQASAGLSADEQEDM